VLDSSNLQKGDCSIRVPKFLLSLLLIDIAEASSVLYFNMVHRESLLSASSNEVPGVPAK